MEYFWEFFWGLMFVVAGSLVATWIGGLWWIGALIGLGIYLIGLVAVKTGLVQAAVDGFVDGILS